MFVTNNSRRSRGKYAKKFLSLGLDVSEVSSKFYCSVDN